MKVKIHTSVVNNVIVSNRKTISKAIQQFNGKNITITIENKKKVRSTLQNRYYWGVIIPIIQIAFKDSWGERKTKEEVHEFLKQEFSFVEKVNVDTGQIVRLTKSTTENSTVQQEEFHIDCRNFAEEWFGVIIPLPNEKLELNLNEVEETLQIEKFDDFEEV